MSNESDAAFAGLERCEQIYGEMLEMLKELQWNDGGWCKPVCPVCLRLEEDGHTEDCRVAALIAKAEGRE